MVVMEEVFFLQPQGYFSKTTVAGFRYKLQECNRKIELVFVVGLMLAYSPRKLGSNSRRNSQT
jgi:hypothetical protein